MLTPDQYRLVDLVVERAEQACRYALKHQNFDGDTDPEYRSGWEVATSVCEKAIKDQVARHIVEDWIDLLRPDQQSKDQSK